MNIIRKIILLGLALVLLVPSAYAIQVGLAGSSNNVGFSDGMTLTGTKDAGLAVQNTVSGGTLSQTVTGSGRLDLHKTFTADDNAGEIAKIIVDVTKAGTLNYVQPAITTTSTSAALTGFTLTATDAAEIDCTSKATNRFGDKSVSSIGVQQGSLNNYRSSAYTDTTGARTDQSLDGANGISINIKDTAADRFGDKAVSSVDVLQGSLNNYRSSAWTDVDRFRAITEQVLDSANGNSIDIEERASNELGNARTSTMISQGTISGYSGEYRYYHNYAVHGSFLITGRRIDRGGIVSGRSIELQSIANNADGAVSSSDTIAKNAVVNGYESNSVVYSAEIWDGLVSEAYQRADTILGGNIQRLTKSVDIGGDKSSTYTEVQSESNKGSVNGYSDGTEATLSSVFAEINPNPYTTSTASGDKIHMDATASDIAGNKATAITEVLKGTISGAENHAEAGISPDKIAASQIGGVTGNKLALDATAINAANLKATKSKRALNLNNIAFHNTASIITGTPAVDQGVP